MKRLSAYFLAMAMFLAPMVAQAGMVSTQSVVDPAAQWMANSALVEKMVDMGIDPSEVQSRIDAMTVAERAELNQSLADMPAGQGILELAFLVFLVFVITDVIGATDIFPFIQPVE